MASSHDGQMAGRAAQCIQPGHTDNSSPVPAMHAAGRGPPRHNNEAAVSVYRECNPANAAGQQRASGTCRQAASRPGVSVVSVLFFNAETVQSQVHVHCCFATLNLMLVSLACTLLITADGQLDKAHLRKWAHANTIMLPCMSKPQTHSFAQWFISQLA